MSSRPESRWPPMSYWAKVTVTILVILALARITLAIGPILVLVLVSLILAFGFQPALAWFERRGVSRGWAVALGLLSGLVVVALFMILVLPGVIGQLSDLARRGPEYLRTAVDQNAFLSDLNQRFDLQTKLQEFVATVPQQALGLIGSFTSLVFNSLTVLILTIYFTINLPKMRAVVAALMGREDREEFHQIYDETIQRVGGYVLGNLVVSGIAGVVSFVALLLIGVPFAAALAFITAVLDLIPTVGALIAAALAGLVAAFAGLPAFIATVAFYLVYQQVENYVIQPRVMGKTIEMSAPLIILAVLIGGSLLGVIGALLAIPTAAIIKVVFRELYLEERIDQVKRRDTAELAAKPDTPS